MLTPPLPEHEVASVSQPPWYRARSYAHFDRPPSKERAVALATDPDAVAAHGFWPLILRPSRVSSRKQDEQGRRVWSTKVRPIGYVAHHDAHIHAYYAWTLAGLLETVYAAPFGEAVLAYRRLDGQCNIHFARDAFDDIGSSGDVTALAVDISGFFDNLCARHLKKEWSGLLGCERLPKDHFAVFRSVTQDTAILVPKLRELFGGEIPRRAGRTRQRICSPTDFRHLVAPCLRPRHELVAELKGKDAGTRKGIPQGTPISAVLANAYMQEVDRELYGSCKAWGGSYRRYSDDILVIVPSAYSRTAEQAITSAVRRVGLEIKPSKTERFLFRGTGASRYALQVDEHGNVGKAGWLAYLGLAFNGQTIRVRDSSVARHLIRMNRAVRRACIAASKSGETKIKRRKLYAQLTSIGWGGAYGTWSSPAPPRTVPRMGFHSYLKRAAAITGSAAIDKQALQLEHNLHRAIARAEKRLKDETEKCCRPGEHCQAK